MKMVLAEIYVKGDFNENSKFYIFGDGLCKKSLKEGVGFCF